jgi:hypothetical protein
MGLVLNLKQGRWVWITHRPSDQTIRMYAMLKGPYREPRAVAFFDPGSSGPFRIEPGPGTVSLYHRASGHRLRVILGLNRSRRGAQPQAQFDDVAQHFRIAREDPEAQRARQAGRDR